MKFTTALLIASMFALMLPAGIGNGQDWTDFRGSNGISAVANAKVPSSFDEEKNVAWKMPLPGRGVSSPIIVGEKIFLTASEGAKEDQLVTLCFDAKSGKQLWEQKVWALGRTLFHPDSANAAPSPTSDGKHVYSFFSSNDLACYDFDGNLVWYRAFAVDRPKAGNDVGMSSSPVVKNGVVVVQIEGSADAVVLGIDAATGKTLWQNERAKDSSWSSPFVMSRKDRDFVIVQSSGYISVHDMKSGEEVFKLEGSVNTIASGGVVNDKLYLPIDGTTSFTMSDDGKLDSVWNSSRARSSAASVIVQGDMFYSLDGQGLLSRFSVDSGELVDKTRDVSGRYWATPTIAGKHMYFFTQDGIARVLDLDTMKVVHKHEYKDQKFMGSPAISGDAMYIRSHKFLYKIASTDGSST